MSLEEAREQYNVVLRSSTATTQQKKMSFLERSLDQLTKVQKQLVEQNLSLKKEVALAERKLLACNERIQTLDSLLSESQDRLNQQNLKYKAQMALVRERFEQAKSISNTILGNAPGLTSLNFGRVAKPLRGGGTRAASQPAQSALSAGVNAQDQAAVSE